MDGSLIDLGYLGDAVKDWTLTRDPLEDPTGIATEFGRKLADLMQPAHLARLGLLAKSAVPWIHLKNFHTNAVVDGECFDSRSTVTADGGTATQRWRRSGRLAASSSYTCESQGWIFVHLTPKPGKGSQAENSSSATEDIDALHFPFPNEFENRTTPHPQRAIFCQYAVVFPEYYFGQIFEARHEPGTVAYSSHLQLELLQETTDEMARNGCKKVIIVNGHGGNEHLLPFFAQTQLEKAHDYVVYIFGLPERPAGGPPRKTSMDMHAGENETSTMLISRPDLVHLDRAGKESGADQARLALPDTLYTAIWWYARFPNHYSGDGSAATKEQGEVDS